MIDMIGVDKSPPPPLLSSASNNLCVSTRRSTNAMKMGSLFLCFLNVTPGPGYKSSVCSRQGREEKMLSVRCIQSNLTMFCTLHSTSSIVWVCLNLSCVCVCVFTMRQSGTRPVIVGPSIRGCSTSYFIILRGFLPPSTHPSPFPRR